jgi:hypothetical protein
MTNQTQSEQDAAVFAGLEDNPAKARALLENVDVTEPEGAAFWERNTARIKHVADNLPAWERRAEAEALLESAAEHVGVDLDDATLARIMTARALSLELAREFPGHSPAVFNRRLMPAVAGSWADALAERDELRAEKLVGLGKMPARDPVTGRFITQGYADADAEERRRLQAEMSRIDVTTAEGQREWAEKEASLQARIAKLSR